MPSHHHFQPLALVLGSPPGPTRRIEEWSSRDSIRLAGLIGAFIVAVLVLGLVLVLVRRRMIERDQDREGAGSLMEELRKMRESGRMSEDEYNAARKSLATKVAGEIKASPATPASFAPKIPRTAVPPPSSQTARPGYDLTGEPLPKPAKDDGNE